MCIGNCKKGIVKRFVFNLNIYSFKLRLPVRNDLINNLKHMKLRIFCYYLKFYPYFIAASLESYEKEIV